MLEQVQEVQEYEAPTYVVADLEQSVAGIAKGSYWVERD